MREIESSIAQKLKSSLKHIILEGMEELRIKGKTNELIHLIDLLNYTNDPEIKSHASSLLFDIKNQHAANILVDCIKNKGYNSIKRILLSACWQSGLDFSGHLVFFTELVRDTDFENAFEAFTVVENCSDNAELSDLETAIIETKKYLGNNQFGGNKLIEKLLLLLEQMKRDKTV
jgi:hypothetical protein